MTGIVSTYLTRLLFFQLKGAFFNLERKDIQSITAGNRPPAEPDVQQKTVSCSCCQWKGKVAESRKAFFTFSAFAETELYCPRCNNYMGFVSGTK